MHFTLKCGIIILTGGRHHLENTTGGIQNVEADRSGSSEGSSRLRGDSSVHRVHRPDEHAAGGYRLVQGDLDHRHHLHPDHGGDDDGRKLHHRCRQQAPTSAQQALCRGAP